MTEPRSAACRALGAATCTALLLVACGRPSLLTGTTPAGADPAVLHIYEPVDPATLNPILASDASAFDILNQTMEGLTRQDATGNILPGIAQSWSSSDGGRTWTFHLRAATWSDGDPVTATDFVYAWRQALDPRNGARYAYQLQYISGAGPLVGFPRPAGASATYTAAQASELAKLLGEVGVSAPNADTLVVHLSKATPYWLGLTSLPVYFPADPARVGPWGLAKYGSDAAHLLSDGPFSVSSWTPKDEIVLQRNPSYWDAAAVHLQQVVVRTVSDAATVANLYDTGSLDALVPSIPTPDVSLYSGKPGFHSIAGAAVVYLDFNVADPVTDNADIRQALSLAIPRGQFASGAAGGGAAPAYALVPPTIDYAPGKPFAPLVGQKLPTAGDVATAKADLAKGLAELGLRQLPKITLLVPALTAPERQADALQSLYQQNLGIRLTIAAADGPTYVSRLEQGSFQLALLDWGADYNDPSTFLEVFETHSGDNFGHWSDAAYDRDMAAAAAETDLQQRGADLAAAEKDLLAQAAVAPLYWPARDWIAHTDVRGLELLPTGPDYSLKDVQLTAS